MLDSHVFALTQFWQVTTCREYLSARLAEGGSLSEALHEHVSAFDHFYTLFPANTPSVEFWRGGRRRPGLRVPGPASVAEEVITDDASLAGVLSLLLSTGESLAAIEKLGSRPGDPSVQRLRCTVRFVEEEVLLVITGRKTTSAPEVLTCIKEAKSLPRTLGILAAPALEIIESIDRSDRLTTTALKEIAAAAEFVFVEIYDGESYLLGLTASGDRKLKQTINDLDQQLGRVEWDSDVGSS